MLAVEKKDFSLSGDSANGRSQLRVRQKVSVEALRVDSIIEGMLAKKKKGGGYG